jgi:hypothetical protein
MSISRFFHMFVFCVAAMALFAFALGLTMIKDWKSFIKLKFLTSKHLF